MTRVLAIAALALLAGCGRFGWVPWEERYAFHLCECVHPDCTPEQSQVAEHWALLDREGRVALLERRGCENAAYWDANRIPGGLGTSGGDTGGSVHVRGYHRRDGTYVRSHSRRRPR